MLAGKLDTVRSCSDQPHWRPSVAVAR